MEESDEDDEKNDEDEDEYYDDGDDVKFYDDLHLGSQGSRAVPVTLPSALCSPPAPDRPPVMRAVLIYFFMPGADDIRIEHPL